LDTCVQIGMVALHRGGGTILGDASYCYLGQNEGQHQGQHLGQYQQKTPS
jgi:hypothetical protein